MRNKLIISGDIRYSELAKELYSDSTKNHKIFLIALQELMKKYGVIKIDVCFDVFTIHKFQE